MDIYERLDRIEKRLQRETDHMLNVLAAQRQITTKAFEQVQVSMLEQEMTIRAHTLAVHEQVADLAEVMKDLARRMETVERKIEPAA